MPHIYLSEEEINTIISCIRSIEGVLKWLNIALNNALNAQLASLAGLRAKLERYTTTRSPPVNQDGGHPEREPTINDFLETLYEVWSNMIKNPPKQTYMTEQGMLHVKEFGVIERINEALKRKGLRPVTEEQAWKWCMAIRDPSLKPKLGLSLKGEQLAQRLKFSPGYVGPGDPRFKYVEWFVGFR